MEWVFLFYDLLINNGGPLGDYEGNLGWEGLAVALLGVAVARATTKLYTQPPILQMEPVAIHANSSQAE